MTDYASDTQKYEDEYMYSFLFFFFFKQKTAYEMSASLVGSEMCIRDRTTGVSNPVRSPRFRASVSDPA